MHWWRWRPGAVWGSVSCPRTLRHTDQGNWTSDMRVFFLPFFVLKTAVCPSDVHVKLHTDAYYLFIYLFFKSIDVGLTLGFRWCCSRINLIKYHVHTRLCYWMLDQYRLSKVALMSQLLFVVPPPTLFSPRLWKLRLKHRCAQWSSNWRRETQFWLEGEALKMNEQIQRKVKQHLEKLFIKSIHTQRLFQIERK